MKLLFSAGGVVYKKEHNKLYILLGKHSGYHKWIFPKGLIGDKIKNEGKEETAIREVKEETGITAKIIYQLQPVTYCFVAEKEKIKKTVYYFIMEYITGETTQHDFEMEDVQWIPQEEVTSYLTYPSDKTVWEEARTKLQNI